MEGWLFDSNGEAWQQGSANLGASHKSLPMPELLRHAVTRLGFAHIVESPRVARLAWRPTLVTEAAFAGTLMALSSLREGRVVVSTLGTEWSHRICASKLAAKNFVVEAFRSAVSEHGGPFMARRRRIESLPQGNPLGRLHAALTAGSVALDPVTLWVALDCNIDRRYVLLHAHGEAPLRVVLWGSGYRTFDNRWVGAAPGALLEDQPDRAYGRWAAETYRSVVRAGQSRLDEVEASIWVPGHGRMTARYTRLVMPIEMECLGRCILSTAVPVWAP